MTFVDLYGTDLDTELGTADRTQRFTTVLRKRYVNEGQRVFNEQTSCFVRRASIDLGLPGQYDLERVGITQEYTTDGVLVTPPLTNDYLWPAKTSGSLLEITSGGTTSYVEGPSLPFKAEEELNQTRPNWRTEPAGTPDCWSLREDGGQLYLLLIPAPNPPHADTWTLLWPYVAVPADMTLDAQEPYSIGGDPRSTLRPYHRAIVHYAAAQLEKLRKNWEGVERQMQLFAAYVAKYRADQAPKRGTSIRLRQDYRTRLRAGVPLRFLDPTRYP